MPATTCEYCRLTYDEGNAADRRRHTKRHKAFREAEFVLTRLPDSYKRREAEKKKAYDLLKRTHDPASQYTGALTLMRAHFDRSLEVSIEEGYWTTHPSFVEYIRMAEYDSVTIPNAVMAAIRAKFPADPGHIPYGHSYWYPPGSAARRAQFEQAKETERRRAKRTS